MEATACQVGHHLGAQEAQPETIPTPPSSPRLKSLPIPGAPQSNLDPSANNNPHPPPSFPTWTIAATSSLGSLFPSTPSLSPTQSERPLLSHLGLKPEPSLWPTDPPHNLPLSTPCPHILALTLSPSAPSTLLSLLFLGLIRFTPASGRCTGCFPAWNALPPHVHMAPISFRALPEGHFLSEAFSDHLCLNSDTLPTLDISLSLAHIFSSLTLVTS